MDQKKVEIRLFQGMIGLLQQFLIGFAMADDQPALSSGMGCVYKIMHPWNCEIFPEPIVDPIFLGDVFFIGSRSETQVQIRRQAAAIGVVPADNAGSKSILACPGERSLRRIEWIKWAGRRADAQPIVGREAHPLDDSAQQDGRNCQLGIIRHGSCLGEYRGGCTQPIEVWQLQVGEAISKYLLVGKFIE